MQTTKRTYGRQRQRTPVNDGDGRGTPPSCPHSPRTMTPRSKIAAMLAELDDDHDDNDAYDRQKDRTRHMAERVQAAAISDEEIEVRASSPSTDLRSERAMLPSVSAIMLGLDNNEDEDEQDENTAYERMRTALLARSRSSVQSDIAQDNLQEDSDSDIDLPDTALALQQSLTTTTPSSKVRELAEKRRQAITADVAEKEGSILAKHQNSGSGSDSEDIEAQIRMSSARRVPRRAANKKAIEAMHKETERLQRNMTLAPEAQVKTKLRVNDFLSKIGFLKQSGSPTDAIMPQMPESSHKQQSSIPDDPFTTRNTSVPAPVGDTAPVVDLPVSKPFAPELEESDSDIELPSMAELVSSQPNPLQEHASSFVEAPINIHEDVLLESDSDSDVIIPQHLMNHKLLFKRRNYEQIRKDRRAAKFVAMARPDSPTKQEARAEKARKAALFALVSKQAKAERRAREESMKAAGITLISAEQRQREALEVEDLVEKARRQANELRKLEEKEDRKKKAEADGVNDFDSEEEQDRDWEADAEASGMSGTEDDDSSGDSDDGDVYEENGVSISRVETTSASPKLSRNASILSERHLSDDDEDGLPIVRKSALQRSRAPRVLGDDSEEDKENSVPEARSVVAEVGLTQFFEATPINIPQRADEDISVSQFCLSPSDQVSRNMQMLRESDHVDHDHVHHNNHSLDATAGSVALPDIIPSSQPDVEAEHSDNHRTQYSIFAPPSSDTLGQPLALTSRTLGQFTQATEVDNTQFPIQIDINEYHKSPEPVVRRLRKASIGDMSTPIVQDNVFKRMRQAMNAEQHRKSRKAFVDDRAVESDDEYAGLGGASDEEVEDAAALQAELADMIDDVSGNDKEGQEKIAAFYAQKDLENDEKLVNTLMNDINNGGLRRKRGAGLLDMEDSEDEEEEEARYKARQAQMRARLLEAQNLTSLADNPKTKAFIDALEDKPTSALYIEIAGEDDVVVPDPSQEHEADAGHTEPSSMPSLLQRTDTLADEEDTQIDSQMRPPARPFKRPTKKRTQADIRRELSFLRDEDDDDLHDTQTLDPSFVPTLKRERSSLTIEDRSTLSRENSISWNDPRTTSSTAAASEESMYAQLAAARTADSLNPASSVTVVVSKGHQMASRMATKAVNYHARAAQAMRASRQQGPSSRIKSGKSGKTVGPAAGKKKDSKVEVLKLFA